MATVRTIIKKLGKPAAIARATGLRLSTIDSWQSSGFVPEWRIATLVKMAEDLSIPLTADDFPKVRPKVRPKPRRQPRSARPESAAA